MENFPLNSMQQLHGAIFMELPSLLLFPWNSMEFHVLIPNGILWNSMDFHGKFSMEFHQEFHGILWGYFTRVVSEADEQELIIT